MAWPRMVWLVLAVGTAVWGAAFVAAEPMYQVSSCEIVHVDAACSGSVLAYYGAGLGVLLAVPVGLCLVPALPGLSRCSWLVAGAILLLSVLALPMTGSMFGVLSYYLPVGVAALVAAGLQRRSAE
ncbi:hypothetical protein [Nocardia huaxiensis]|uniref:hypothetical protein n=1 Tax=Nocardia huaxiensis TaxID=2755382 RepID=UPI001E534A49|nr:hypothetical protein [Nocardia huaxiensis]UFS97617.1 hypothetical protein LPY97_06845 [Nocardia huaxiensis]